MLYIKLFIERENTGQSAPECPFNGSPGALMAHLVTDSRQDMAFSRLCNCVSVCWLFVT